MSRLQQTVTFDCASTGEMATPYNCGPRLFPLLVYNTCTWLGLVDNESGASGMAVPLPAQVVVIAIITKVRYTSKHPANEPFVNDKKTRLSLGAEILLLVWSSYSYFFILCTRNSRSFTWPPVCRQTSTSPSTLACARSCLNCVPSRPMHVKPKHSSMR